MADAVKANILASRGSMGVFNIACGKSISLNNLAAMIGKILGLQVMSRYVAPRPGDIRLSLADISRAKSIGYLPDYGIEEGLKETIEWYRVYLL